ncbi:MAG: DUF354 domain-containing protein, partial [Acidobacteriota bacterium]|nr:DUF354 domain-containing protein [Acidobacteriota bacterium]
AESLLKSLGIRAGQVLIVIRPPARDALYHRFENELFDALLAYLCAHPLARVVLLARTDAQRAELAARHPSQKIIMPQAALDGSLLISAADLVISAGGTMNREAAALGTPAATIYAGKWAAVDEELVRRGQLQRISTLSDITLLRVGKKKHPHARRALDVRAEVTELILQ